MLTNLLIYRYVLFNAVCATLTVWLYDQDLLLPLFAADSTHITHGIVAVFVVGWCALLRQVLHTAHQLNAQKRMGPVPSTQHECDKAMVKLEWLAEIPEFLVGLGLIGTVIGFSLALSGVDSAALYDVSGVQQSIQHLIAGMKVALNTTIAGSVLGVWHYVCWRLLHTANCSMWADRLGAWG